MTSQQMIPRAERDTSVTAQMPVAELQSAKANGQALLLQNARVISMDETVGDLEAADVLVRGSKIAAVGASLAADPAAVGALRIDLTGATVLPGFVDTHRHCWLGQFRHRLPDVDLAGYVEAAHETWAPRYTPEDTYVGTLLSVLSAIDSGTTTLLDFAHNARSNEHTDAGFEAYAVAGARVVHASSGPRVGGAAQWPMDLVRVRQEWRTAPGSMRDVRLAMFTPHRQRFSELGLFAREQGLSVSIDAIAGPGGSETVRELASLDMLGPEVNLIHCSGLDESAWDLIAATGTTVSLTPTSDSMIGLGDGSSPAGAVLSGRVQGSISTDVDTSLAGDMFAEMVAALIAQRAETQADLVQGRRGGRRTSVREVLELATRGGATVLGASDVFGSITPGRSADLVVHLSDGLLGGLDADPIAGLVLGGSRRSVDAVLIAGEPQKWAGALVGVDLDDLQSRTRRSVERIAGG